MKVRLIAVLAAALMLAGVTVPPAAAEQAPAPKPVWWAERGYGDLRPGYWLACLPDWASIDCVEGVDVRRADSTTWAPLRFVPDKDFDPSKMRQWWASAANAEPGSWGQDAWIRTDTNPTGGMWVIPETVTTSYSREIGVLVQLNSGNVHFSVFGGRTWRTDNADPDLYYRLNLRTTELQHYVTWVYSNSHDAAITFPDQNHVFISGRAATRYDPKPSDYDNPCGPNTTAESAPIGVEVMGMIRNNIRDDEPMGQVVLGTNGWYCIDGLQYDEKSGQLTVKVGTNHFDPSGKPIEGWVEVKVRGELVRRWWGVNPKLIAGSARVEVVYEDGTSVIASTNASYDAERDWIDLRSYGFHYSSPTLGIKAVKTQANADQPAVVVPAAPAPKKIAPKKIAPKKTEITCVKGKTVKKVAAVAPKCPAGFKKR